MDRRIRRIRLMIAIPAIIRNIRYSVFMVDKYIHFFLENMGMITISATIRNNCYSVSMVDKYVFFYSYVLLHSLSNG